LTKFIDAGSSGEWGWHATELALRCPRLFAYTYRFGPHGEEGDRPALLKGSLIHQGLAHHYARLESIQHGRDPEEWARTDVAIEACAEKLGRHAAKYIDTAKRVVSQYAAHWAHERLEVLHVEEVFKSDIGGYVFTQRFDLVVREPDGKVYIYDHKTTGRLSSAVAERYTLSGQFLGMANFGSRVWGSEFGGVKLNLIEIGDQKPGGNAAFKRQTPDPAPAAIKSFPLTVLHAREKIAELDKSGLAPADWPMTMSEQTCITAYGPCGYFDKCRFE
jgi:hypothetical protein